MKIYNSAWVAALEKGEAVTHGAIKIETNGYDPLLVWGGHGTLTLDAEDYVGIAERGLVTVAGGQLGSGEQGINIRLSGVDPDTEIDLLSAKRAPVLIWRLGFDNSGRTLLDATKFTRGRIDQLYREETVGGESMIVGEVEGAVRGMGRHSARMRSDADQRMIAPNDAGFRNIASAGEKSLYWGGQKPVRAVVGLNGQVTGVTNPGGLLGSIIGRR
jgi:hypothetical protein